MKIAISISILVLSTFLTTFAQPTLTTIELNRDWKFRQADKNEWHPATVPGCVHTDLLANKLIEDPFFRDNEKRQQWIGKTDWEYQTTINVTAELVR